MSYVKR